jgi:hypothetical protein
MHPDSVSLNLVAARRPGVASRKTSSRALVDSRRQVFGFLAVPLLIGLLGAPALAEDSMTLLNCGSAPVVDSYNATESAQDDRPVAGPIKCETANDIANGLNSSQGCCSQSYISSVKKLAEQRAESSCNESAGSNFACDIFPTKTTVCAEGCGMTSTPVDNPLGCSAPSGSSQCTGTARVVPTADESKCLVMCAVSVTATATGKFSLSCGTCTAEKNCEAMGEIEIRKRAEVAELEGARRALEAQLAALSPNDPNYLSSVIAISNQLGAVVAQLSSVAGWISNLAKIYSVARIVLGCGGQNG